MVCNEWCCRIPTFISWDITWFLDSIDCTMECVIVLGRREWQTALLKPLKLHRMTKLLSQQMLQPHRIPVGCFVEVLFSCEMLWGDALPYQVLWEGLLLCQVL